MHPGSNEASRFSLIPLPQNALLAAQDGLKSFGYREEMIKKSFSFADRTGQSLTVDALAFTHEVHRTPDYTGVTVCNLMNGIANEQVLVQALANSAAPFHLIHRNETRRFSFWFSNASSRSEKEASLTHVESDIAYDQLLGILGKYAADINPQRITNVKHGMEEFVQFRATGPFQLTLWAFDVTADLLVSNFAQVSNFLASFQDKRTGAKIPAQSVTDIAIQLLGAVILSHTGALGDRLRVENPPLEHLLRIARLRYPRYFKVKLIEDWSEASTQAYEMLIQLRYSGFSPEMLTQLYREAYPNLKDRRLLGRYDTPLYLTRRIWQTIPVEFLAPEERTTADMTCGWGSFLIAGYERLSRLPDSPESLRKYIHGNDKDPFASRLAGLGLLVSTSDDDWHIDSEDALTWRWLDRRPNIIVGNPPFGADRKTQKGRGKRYQEADRFLSRALSRLAENGYLALLMPQSFLSTQASSELRKDLLSHCDILEMLQLPLSVFQEARVSPVVIVAQKKRAPSTTHAPVKIRSVQNATLDQFRSTGEVTASNLVCDQSAWNTVSYRNVTHIMDLRVILSEREWNGIWSRCIELDEIAVVRGGAVRGDPAKGDWAEYEEPRAVNLLSGKAALPRPFFIDYDTATLAQYPNDFVRPGKSQSYMDDPSRNKELLFAGTKILVVSDPNPSWGKRLKVAIDRRECFVTNTFFMVRAKDLNKIEGLTNEVIAAVLDWHVCNSWAVEHLQGPWLSARVLRNMPFPSLLTKSDCQVLTSAVLELETATMRDIPRPKTVVENIDQVLLNAYDLSPGTLERLRAISNWDQNPIISLDEPVFEKALWNSTGVVDAVQPQDGTISLWLNDTQTTLSVPISPRMPGWLLRQGIPFRVKYPRGSTGQTTTDVARGRFQPQYYSYLSDYELLGLLSDLTNADSRRTDDKM